MSESAQECWQRDQAQQASNTLAQVGQVGGDSTSLLSFLLLVLVGSAKRGTRPICTDIHGLWAIESQLDHVLRCHAALSPPDREIMDKQMPARGRKWVPAMFSKLALSMAALEHSIARRKRSLRHRLQWQIVDHPGRKPQQAVTAGLRTT